jgi:class 3 adenylate cyclase
MTLNIAQKIFATALIGLLFMAAAAAHSIYMTKRISHELDVIANLHVPLDDVLSQNSLSVLERDVHLQRLLVRASNDGDSSLVVQGRNRLTIWDQQVVEELETADELLERPKGLTSLAAQEISEIAPVMQALGAEYRVLGELGNDVINALIVADIDTFNALFPVLNSRQDAFESTLETLRLDIETATRLAVLRADADERRSLISNVVLTGIASIFGLAVAFIVTRILVQATRNLVAGTDAVRDGNLDVEVAKVSHDEVGKLTDAFNHMVGELRLKERIKETFGKYMDPRIVRNLLDNPKASNPGGERREMSVMFIDLKGFTSISEVLSPQDLVALLNNFFSHMTEAIATNGGVVDKFMGDAVMAYWGPPFTDADEHATLACRAASRALQQFEEFRNEVKSHVGDAAAELELDLRIGVSSGEMIVGTIGSKATRSFTVTGDPVNLGARLEGANKVYGTRILVSERTRELVDPSIEMREIDLIRVKGKSAPTRIFEVVDGASGKAIPEAARKAFEQGVGAYRKLDWDGADAAFQEVENVFAADPPSKIFRERIAQLRQEPPPSDWDGVWDFKTK